MIFGKTIRAKTPALNKTWFLSPYAIPCPIYLQSYIIEHKEEPISILDLLYFTLLIS